MEKPDLIKTFSLEEITDILLDRINENYNEENKYKAAETIGFCNNKNHRIENKEILKIENIIICCYKD